MDEGQDVKEVADTSAADSSPAEGAVNDGASQESAGASAETLNTEAEQIPEHVPYSRFKEINEAKKKMEEQIGQLQHYQQFDQILASNPDLFEKVKGALQEYVGKSQGNIGGDDPVQGLQNQVQQLVVQRNIDAYQNEFNQLTKDLSQQEKAALERLTEIEMYKMTQNPYVRYYPGFLQKAFEGAKKLVDDIKSSEKSNYIKAKEGDIAHTTRGGAPVAKSEDFSSREKRASFIAKALKAGA